jgi:hypothetical protein
VTMGDLVEHQFLGFPTGHSGLVVRTESQKSAFVTTSPGDLKDLIIVKSQCASGLNIP